jgi:hypothetical protein
MGDAQGACCFFARHSRESGNDDRWSQTAAFPSMTQMDIFHPFDSHQE